MSDRDDELTGLPQPRRHHYRFAHEALCTSFFEVPFELIGVFQTSDATAEMQRYWDFVGQDLGDATLPSGGLACTTEMHFGIDRGDGLGAPVHLCFVTLPPARQTTEAHFICMAFAIDDNGEPVVQRYFTLEHALGDGGAAITMLGEWRDGAHLNYGVGPAPELALFRGHVERLLGGDGGPA